MNVNSPRVSMLVPVAAESVMPSPKFETIVKGIASMEQVPQTPENLGVIASRIALNFVKFYGRSNLLTWLLNRMNEGEVVQLYLGQSPCNRTRLTNLILG